MLLREINEQDIAIIRIWPAYPEEFKDLDYALRDSGWINEYLGKDSTRIYIAEESGVAIGFTILSKDSATSREAEFRIALNPDYLGQGFGKKLTRMTLEKGFQELGLQRIYLIVRKSNPRQEGFMRIAVLWKLENAARRSRELWLTSSRWLWRSRLLK